MLEVPCDIGEEHRSQLDPTQSIVALKSQWGCESRVYSSPLSSEVLGSKTHQPLPRAAAAPQPAGARQAEAALAVHTHTLEQRVPVRSDKVAAIDPGVRRFIATYDQVGDVSECGSDDAKRLYRLAVRVSKTNPKAPHVNTHHRQRRVSCLRHDHLCPVHAT